VSAANGVCSIPSRLLFRRLVDIPFEVCAAALERWSWHDERDGELLIGRSGLRGPIEHDRDSDTCTVEVRLARGTAALAAAHEARCRALVVVVLEHRARTHPVRAPPGDRRLLPPGHLLLDRLTHRLRLEAPSQSLTTVVTDDTQSRAKREES
jgi:hypothetical protein